MNEPQETIRTRWYFGRVPNHPAEPELLDNFAKLLGGYNLQVIDGYHKGMREETLVIEYVGSHSPEQGYGLADAADNYLTATGQEEVLITKDFIESYMFNPGAFQESTEQAEDSGAEWC